MALDTPHLTETTHASGTGRESVRFASGDTTCAAGHYPGTNGACVVMAAGMAVTKEPGTDRFAERFHAAGFSVLAFDFRRLGESGGGPRQVVRMVEQQVDFRAAIGFARSLPGVDPARVAIWGFSLSGGHVFPVASGDPDLGAAIAVSPGLGGQAAARNAMHHQTRAALLRLTGRGVVDAIGGLAGREPLLVPLVGERGEVAVLTTPDARNGPAALNPGNRYPDWLQAVAARSALRIGFYRPARYAPRVPCPLMVVVCEQDGVALAAPAVRAAAHAPRGEVERLPGGHYAPFLDGHQRAVEVQLTFLRRHLLA
jgi:uncharacterized protein